jgi:hypothetical protein
MQQASLLFTRNVLDKRVQARERQSGHTAESASNSRVWWLESKRSAALDDGATGGMNAGILLAHAVAAAKVRLQSLQSHNDPATYCSNEQ